jgi:uncharacterized protein (TIGR02646 family)
MKLLKKAPATPDLLNNFVAAQPLADWDRFKNSKARYKQTAAQIRRDQRGVCAYCEINLLEAATPDKLPDFRIEHFHPKTPHAPPPNWAIAWTNLLGTCHGGSQRDVADPARFTAPDLCCDVPKGDNDWTADIFNPLVDVPAFPRLFKYVESDGSVDVDLSLCPAASVGKAKETIARLNLNAPRLIRLRRAVIDGIREQIEKLLANGATIEDASRDLSSAMFPNEPDKDWPAFFTCVRWYLTHAAEDRLTEIGYS